MWQNLNSFSLIFKKKAPMGQHTFGFLRFWNPDFLILGIVRKHYLFLEFQAIKFSKRLCIWIKWRGGGGKSLDWKSLFVMCGIYLDICFCCILFHVVICPFIKFNKKTAGPIMKNPAIFIKSTFLNIYINSTN